MRYPARDVAPRIGDIVQFADDPDMLLDLRLQSVYIEYWMFNVHESIRSQT